MSDGLVVVHADGSVGSTSELEAPQRPAANESLRLIAARNATLNYATPQRSA